MAGIKSLICRVEIDIAARKHHCRRNKNHIIEKGQRRLKVRNGRSWMHYCMACAKQSVVRDINELRTLETTIDSDA